MSGRPGAAARGTLRPRSRRPSAAPASRGRGRPPAPPPSSPWAAGSSGSAAAAGRPPSREPIAMSAGRASRAGGRKRLAGSGAADGVPEGGAAAPHARNARPRSIAERHGPADHRESHQTVHRHQRPPRRPRGRSPRRARARHRPVCGRHRRNAAMARRPRANSPAAGPQTASALAAVTSTPVADRAGRDAAPRPLRPRLPDCAPVPPGHPWPEPRFRPWPTLRRRRRRVTRQGRSASAGPAKRVDSVTAVALPAAN